LLFPCFSTAPAGSCALPGRTTPQPALWPPWNAGCQAPIISASATPTAMLSSSHPWRRLPSLRGWKTCWPQRVRAAPRPTPSPSQVRLTAQEPEETVTGVAPFQADADQPYLNFHIRQAIHMRSNGAGGIDAFLDLRNLLAEGYRPYLLSDGSLVIFAQDQRSLGGGLAFTF